MTQPLFTGQIEPLAEMALRLGVDYLVYKHCSDSEGKLGIKYDEYEHMVGELFEAAAMSTEETQITAKWGKLSEGADRSYDRCLGPMLQLQISGSGLVAPCGMLFEDKFKEYHIGNIRDTRFIEMFNSDRYWEVMAKLASPDFPIEICGSLCLQHRVNGALFKAQETGKIPWSWKYGNILHKNFL